MRVLTVNAGSSSLKLRLLGPADQLIAAADVDGSTLGDAVASLGAFDAVGHRIVHGGRSFTTPVRVDHNVIAELHRLVELAPLHQPIAVQALEAVGRIAPEVPAVACFDTAFHATLPASAATYAIPERWRRLGVRRYGFHGLSHAYASRRAGELLGRATDLRIVTCHLGAGASLAAVDHGRSVDTTMGFTPLEGLVMATRSGSIDPGLPLWLGRHAGLTVDEVDHALEHESGLIALAGTRDMRVVVDRADAGDDASRLALDVYLHRLRGSIAAMAASMQGLDALVFTGGVGERSERVRELAAADLRFLGVRIDSSRNAAGHDDRDISAADSVVRTLVVTAREDIEIARGVRQVLLP